MCQPTRANGIALRPQAQKVRWPSAAATMDPANERTRHQRVVKGAPRNARTCRLSRLPAALGRRARTAGGPAALLALGLPGLGLLARASEQQHRGTRPIATIRNATTATKLTKPFSTR